MKYIVLGGERYYPTGGRDALFGSDDIEVAITNARSYLGITLRDESNFRKKVEWAEVVDTDSLEIVWSSYDEN